MNPTTFDILDLEKIRDGFPGLTPKCGEFLLEAVAVCLSKNNHESGVILELTGDFDKKVQLFWSLPITSQLERSWSNQKEATESAAIGIAALLIAHFTDYTIVEKANEGTGIDYWLGRKDRIRDHLDIFQRDARLEVSGIFQGTQSEIANRFKMKLIQTERSDATDLPAFVCVVEFGLPQSRLSRKK